MSEAAILKQVKQNSIFEITLNRPAVFNGFNEELLTALGNALSEVEKDSKIRAVILRGAGKHFSAGADINWFKNLAEASESEQKTAASLTTGVMQKLFQCPIPTIALVHNACFGGGVGYIAGCDVVLASEDARFAITEVRVGITPAPILPQIIDAIGVRQARRYTLTGETFDVHEAQRIGLVHEVCAVNGLDEAVKPITEAILLSAPKAVVETKELINNISGKLATKSLLEKLASVSARGRNTPEGLEGFSAFLEKRQPHWHELD